MDGFIIINKPVGLSSFDVIRRLRKRFGKLKMGHAGTLDPLASGVLPIAFGKATKQIPALPQEKEYIAEIVLGICTTTDDIGGEIITQNDTFKLTEEIVKCAIQENFIGVISQKPPLYSARHFQGQRLYKLARLNKSPSLKEIPEKKIEVHEFEIIEFTGGAKTALKCRIRCSSGTYIRSLARDLGEKLKVGGSLKSLIRILSGGFRIEQSKELADILIADIQ